MSKTNAHHVKSVDLDVALSPLLGETEESQFIELDTTSKTTHSRNPNLNKHWKGSQKWMWTFALFFMSVLNYSCRNAVPISAVAMGTELGWDKAQTGLVLSSFFWGYALTQVPAGYISDVIGGDQVVTLAAIGWGSLTVVMPFITSMFTDKSTQMTALVIQRVIFGILQALHYPAVISLLSQKAPAEGKTTIYTIVVSGSPAGVVLCGSIGSYLLQRYTWMSVFYVAGISAVVWALFIRHCLMDKTCSRVQAKKSASELLHRKQGSGSQKMPWRLWFRHRAFWGMMTAGFCSGFAFYLLFSWMPTYFEENFPGEKGWVFNVVPWLVSAPSRITAGIIADRLISRYSVTASRKIIQAVYAIGITSCLLVFPYLKSYAASLAVITCVLMFDSLNSASTSINPQDLAPDWAGIVYGFYNSANSIPGFFGVYISGYILHLTGSWASVFNSTAVICAIGAVSFIVFGSGEPIH